MIATLPTRRLGTELQLTPWIGAATLELTLEDLDEIALAIGRSGAGNGPALPK